MPQEWQRLSSLTAIERLLPVWVDAFTREVSGAVKSPEVGE